MVAVSMLSVRLVSSSFPLAFTCLMIYRFFHGFSYSMFFALYSDCVVYGEWKTGVSIPGFTLGLSSMAAQLGTMIKSWLLPLILIWVKFDASIPASEASQELIVGVQNMFALIPGSIRLLGALALLFCYKITREMLEKCEKEIAERAAAV